MKALNPQRLKGLAAFGLTYLQLSNLTAISLAVGPTLPLIGLAATALYGMTSFQESQTIKSIESLEDGNLRFTIFKSPFVTYTVTANAKYIRSICSLGDDDIGADDTETNVIYLKKYQDSNGEHQVDGVFKLPADAFRDKEFLEWILAPKSEDETTADDFTDLMRLKFNHRV